VRDWQPGKVALYLSEKVALEQVETNRADVERVLGEITGARTIYTTQHGPAAAASAAPALVSSEVAREADAAAVDRRRRESEAREHPMIRKAEELFGTSAREIKTP
jgi:hypothetical protein